MHVIEVETNAVVVLNDAPLIRTVQWDWKHLYEPDFMQVDTYQTQMKSYSGKPGEIVEAWLNWSCPEGMVHDIHDMFEFDIVIIISEMNRVFATSYASGVMPPPLGAGGIMFSGCPSVRPSEAWNTLFWPVHGFVGPPDQPWPFYGMSVRPSLRPERFPGICRRMHWGIGLKFYMLMYLDHLQNWLVYGLGLLIFLILALFWLNETGQTWGFRAFPGERIEGMAWNFTSWCILTIFRTD